MAGLLHLTRRFFGAIRPGPPAADDERWAIDLLLPGEVEIWRRMNNPDRRHAIGVARSVSAALGRSPEPDRAVLAAALLHDCGKVVSRFRTPSRVLATLWWGLAGDDLVDRWLKGSGYRARLAQYRRHPALGAELLQQAGSAPLTHRWAREHHQPEDTWSVPLEVGSVLKACDDD